MASSSAAAAVVEDFDAEMAEHVTFEGASTASQAEVELPFQCASCGMESAQYNMLVYSDEDNQSFVHLNT